MRAEERGARYWANGSCQAAALFLVFAATFGFGLGIGASAVSAPAASGAGFLGRGATWRTG